MSVNGSRERKCRNFPIGFGSIKNDNGNGNGSGSFRKSYSVSPSDYKLLEEVGYGATATVHRAVYIPSNEIVAVKCLDLERCNSNLDDIRREAQTMSLIDHPNVISAYCSFVVEHYLWVIMPFMAEGSCLHLMQIAYPDGFEESVIGSILKETLKALVYLHGHGHIHRDVKAGNVLLDSTGVVKLSDFGVSACMFDKGDRKHARNTFVGTPCWMAPEVLRPESGYDFKADIWSFGITALELAHGHAPFSKYPPMKVLLMTLQNAPPGLDYDRDKRFSKSFKEMVAMCLVKDQTKRPTAEKLLKHSFFKHTKLPELSVKSLLADLPPLWDRVQALQLKDAAQLALKKLPSSEQEAISQSEYQRGVSAWNFDIEDLKAQASLIQDDDDLSEIKEDDGSRKLFANVKDPSIPSSGQGISSVSNEINCREKRCSTEGSGASLSSNKDVLVETSSLGSRNQEALNENVKSQSKIGLTAISSTSNQSIEANKWKLQTGKKQQTYSGPLIASSFHSSSFLEKGNNSYRSEGENHLAIDKNKQNVPKVPVSDILMLPTRASANSLSAPMRSSGGYGDSLEDESKSNSVEIKGRFSVTSENLDLVKDVPLCTIPRRSSQQTNLYPKETANDSVPASILMPHLQNLLQQTSFQQDLIINLLNSLQRNKLDDTLQNGISSQTQPAEDDILAGTTITERERVLLMKIAELQARMVSLTHELTAERLKVNKLQEYLNAVYRQEEMEDSLDAAINGS